MSPQLARAQATEAPDLRLVDSGSSKYFELRVLKSFLNPYSVEPVGLAEVQSTFYWHGHMVRVNWEASTNDRKGENISEARGPDIEILGFHRPFPMDHEELGKTVFPEGDSWFTDMLDSYKVELSKVWEAVEQHLVIRRLL